MPITPALQIVTWCVLISSLSILWVAGLLSPWLIVMGYAAVAVSAVRVRLGAKPWIAPERWRWLTLAALTMFVVEWTVLDADLLTASLHLLLYLMIYKLLTLERSRDYLHLYLIGFFQLLASTSTTAELPYGVVFFCYVVLTPWTLMLYTLQLESEQQTALGHLAVIRWPFFLMTTITAVGTFLLTLAIFFLIPRMSSGYMQPGGAAPANRIGFSERVELGTIGAIKQDPTVVMRVGVTSRTMLSRAAIYWRGTAYDVYDGASWQKQTTTRMGVLRGGDGWFHVPSRQTAQSVSQSAVRQDVILEPLETTVLFAAAKPVAVSGPLPSLRIDGQGTLLLANPPAGRIHYQVDSVPPRLADADRQVTLEDYGRVPLIYLQLPSGSERLVGLARSVVSAPAGLSDLTDLTDRSDLAGLAAPAKSAATLPVFEAADRIERYLKRNYRYTLDVKPPRQLSAIDDFLFEQKAGYCEYYATAMVLMLRGLGIPTRLVSGFLSGEWNEFGNYFTVREKDAHTWVEVYFPGTGWYPFDPTPSVDGPPALLGSVRQLIDTMWISWDRYIVRFSIRDQVSAWQEMRSHGTAWQGRSLQWLESVKIDLKAAVDWAVHRREIGLLLIAAGCFGFLVMRWWAQRHGGWPFWQAQSLPATQRSGRTFYTNLLRLLAERGVRKPPTLTALEFVQVMGPELGPVAGAVETLTAYYHRLRFGATPLTDEEQRDVARLLRQIKG